MALALVVAVPAGAHAWYVNAKTSPLSGQGTITPAGNTSYPTGVDSGEYTVTPAAGYAVARVTVDGIATSPNANGKYVVPYVAGKTWRYIVAYFQATSVSITLTGGDATGSLRERDGLSLTNIPLGSTRNILIEPATGYQIASYSASGSPSQDILNADGTRTITYSNLQASQSVAATFSPVLSVVADAGADLMTEGDGPAYTVLLDGSRSSSNQGTISYLWTAPPALVLATPTQMKTTAYSETAGTYVATLTITSNGVSSSDTAVVIVQSVQQACLNVCASCHQARDPLIVLAYEESVHLSGKNGASCKSCHENPPEGHHSEPNPASSCFDCHGSGRGHSAKPVDTCGGCHDPHSLEGVWGDAGCTFCHGYPPTSGAHAVHFGLAETTGDYEDLGTLETRFPTATGVEAPSVYAFGCAHCHSADPARHMNDVVDILLYEESAPSDSLKGRAAVGAAYDPLSGSCSGIYCHSSGQAQPAYRTTPAWTSTAKLACSDCHGNPPAYPSGGAGTATANSHIGLAADGHEWGHFLGQPGPWMTSRHGGNYRPSEGAAPITCQTCHFETTDPTNTGPGGFYYLDTTGTYALPGGDPARTVVQPGDPSGVSWQARQQCGHCHRSGGAAVGAGKILPLRHVNGSRDVHFDPRDTAVQIPSAGGGYAYPYWVTGSRSDADWPPEVNRNGSVVSFNLRRVSYDPQTKKCASTACHLADTNPVWGRPLTMERSAACFLCHASK